MTKSLQSRNSYNNTFMSSISFFNQNNYILGLHSRNRCLNQSIIKWEAKLLKTIWDGNYIFCVISLLLFGVSRLNAKNITPIFEYNASHIWGKEFILPAFLILEKSFFLPVLNWLKYFFAFSLAYYLDSILCEIWVKSS